MNKMYTLGTKVEVVTDHEPLIPIYNSAQKPKQLRVNSHRIKLLPFEYRSTYEPRKTTPCDYGSVILNNIPSLMKRLKIGA